MKAAAKIWSRSKHGFRYTTLLSDGDVKTHKFLNSLKIYGPDVEILKEECINHVSKKGVYLHWLDLAANKAHPLCVHARMDGDHLLNALDSMTTSSVGTERGSASNGQEAKHGRWINK
ncbi:hypothetical protein TNCV_4136541 [Trichonephila clavipes]|nr:hypothetical protein TNCV_4136541 [Trichonephila clavipes]